MKTGNLVSMLGCFIGIFGILIESLTLIYSMLIIIIIGHFIWIHETLSSHNTSKSKEGYTNLEVG